MRLDADDVARLDARSDELRAAAVCAIEERARAAAVRTAARADKTREQGRSDASKLTVELIVEELRLRTERGEDIERVPKRSKRDWVASLEAARRRVPDIPSSSRDAGAGGAPPHPPAAPAPAAVARPDLEDSVGRRCMVLWTGEDDDSADEGAAAMYPALVVKRIKASMDPGITHLIHFDDGFTERVGLPDDGIVFTAQPRVDRCRCAKCVLHNDSGRALPIK